MREKTRRAKRKQKRNIFIILILALVSVMFISNLFWMYKISKLSDKLWKAELRIESLDAQVQKVGEYMKVVEELVKVGKDKLTPHQITEMAKIIVNYSEQHSDIGLSPAIIFAVMQKESNFNPVAISSAKAYGLMQVLKSTAYPIMDKLGYERSENNLLDPIINLKVGIEYLIQMKKLWLAEKVETPEDWKITFHSYFWGERWTRKLLYSGKRVDVPSLEYGAGVQKLVNSWMEKGLW